MKKKALLITMYYHPLNIIAVNRMDIFTGALELAGFDTAVLSRSYTQKTLDHPNLLVASENSEQYSNAFVGNLHVTHLPFAAANSKLNTSKKMPMGLRGLYNWWVTDPYHHDFYDTVLQELEKRALKYDVIVLSYGPPIILKLARAVAKKYAKKVILDYRDSFITEADSGLTLKIKQQIARRVHHAVHAVTYAAQGISDSMQLNLLKGEGMSVLNGVTPDEKMTIVSTTEEETGILEQFKTLKQDNQLLFLHAGSFYDGQELTYTVELIRTWAAQTNTKYKLFFMGATAEDVHLKGEDVIYTKRVSKELARYFVKQADVLLLPVWRNRYTGYSGKLFEYLYAGRPIICEPNPQKDLAAQLNDNPNAYIFSGNQQKDLTQFNKLHTNNFQTKPYAKEKYTHEFQIKRLVELLTKI